MPLSPTQTITKEPNMKRKKHTKSKFIFLIVTLIAIAIFIYQENQKLIVCLDAGHGGHDARLSFCQWQTI